MVSENNSINNLCPVCGGNGYYIGNRDRAISCDNNDLIECESCQQRWKLSEQKETTLLANNIHERSDSTPSSWLLSQLPKHLLSQKEVRVLDVGCWTGDVLLGLPSYWDRCGVELNSQAAKEAENKGLLVQHGTLESVDLDPDSFDLVIMLDVLEHLIDPFTTMKNISKVLKPSGFFVAMTGSGDCSASKFFKDNWYYCNYPEHISFFSRKSIKHLMGRVQLDVEKIESISHPTASSTATMIKLFSKLTGTYKKNDDELPLSRPGRSKVMLVLSRILRRKDHYLIVGRAK